MSVVSVRASALHRPCSTSSNGDPQCVDEKPLQSPVHCLAAKAWPSSWLPLYLALAQKIAEGTM
jgi:hypothetical protein